MSLGVVTPLSPFSLFLQRTLHEGNLLSGLRTPMLFQVMKLLYQTPIMGMWGYCPLSPLEVSVVGYGCKKLDRMV